jgi:hypothetical protein
VNATLMRRLTGAIALMAVALLPGCAKTAEQKHVIKEPVTIEKDEGTGLGRLTLTQKAAERIGIETVAVEDVEGRRVVSSNAVIVDADGRRYVYTNPRPLVFHREPIQVDTENDGRAWLSEGPPSGTRVVTIGAAELHGAETGIK